MKANEVPKSKFVYPDKLYARCKDNKTLDISYAPQTLEAVEYIRTDAFIEKAEVYLKGRLLRYIDLCVRGVGISTDEFIEKFKNYMKGK